jgi:hypothetical protein
MAAKFSTTTEKITRQDTFHAAPADVTPGRNSRGIKSSNYDDEVTALAVSIATEGQKVPAVGHKDKDGKIVLDGGFKRRDAIEKLRTGVTDGDGRVHHDPKATLWITVDRGTKTEKDAFVASIIENLHVPVTDVQEMKAHQVLRDEYHYVNAEIARLYIYNNQNRVDKLEKLSTMGSGVIDLVHQGKLAMSVAVDDLFGNDVDTIRQVLAAAQDENGYVNGAKVRELLRSLANGDEIENPGVESVDEGDGESTPARSRTTKEKKFKRTVKNLNTFCEGYAKLEDGNVKAKELLDVLQRWVNGDLATDRRLLDVLDSLK